jgi:hypothetical protein
MDPSKSSGKQSVFTMAMEVVVPCTIDDPGMAESHPLVRVVRRRSATELVPIFEANARGYPQPHPLKFAWIAGLETKERAWTIHSSICWVSLT